MSGKRKVLVVDDDRRMVRTLCDILRMEGYEPSEAFTGEEAVLKARAHKPDCVLMDIKMPGIDGIEALKRIKETWSDVPVVLMSAYITEMQDTESRKEGAYVVLTKPIDIRKLLSFLSLLKDEVRACVVDDCRESLKRGGQR